MPTQGTPVSKTILRLRETSPTYSFQTSVDRRHTSPTFAFQTLVTNDPAFNTVNFTDSAVPAAGSEWSRLPSSTLEFAQILDTNFKLLNPQQTLGVNQSISFQIDYVRQASNSIAFSQLTEDNFILASASNSIAFSQLAENNFVFESASDSIAFSLLAENNFVFESASNSFSFSLLAENNFKFESASNSITFAQTATVIQTLQRSLTDTIAFNDLVLEKGIQVYANNALAFTNQVVSAGSTLNLSVSDSIFFDDRARPTAVETASSSIAFSQDASREHAAENSISFSQTVTTTLGSVSNQSITFTDTAAVAGEFGIATSSTITFTDNALGIIETPCDLHEYTPIGTLAAAPTLVANTSITLTYSAFNVTLRNPELGNGDAVESFRVFRQTRGGEYSAYRASYWPTETSLDYSFRALTRTEAQDFLQFYKDSLGQEVTLVDHENRSWTGILESVQAPVLDAGGFVTDCKYQASLVFVGSPT